MLVLGEVTRPAPPPHPNPPAADRFIYEGYNLDRTSGQLTCSYRFGGDDESDLAFEEIYFFDPELLADASEAALDRAARLVFLLAAVSYYKAAAPPRVDLNGHDLTATEASFLAEYYRYGLGEFAVTNGMPLIQINFEGARLDAPATPLAEGELIADLDRPLVPFGGGLDSIVTLERLRPLVELPTLFVVSRPNDLYEAIATAADVADAPLINVGRQLDPKILESRQRGYLNGHVPVTGVLSSVAVVAAVAGGHGAVIMSNEWSASFGNVEVDGESVNHQYSKSEQFENAFRAVLNESFGDKLQYFSMLRADSELRIANEFKELERYHLTFRSCNRAFHLDPAARWDHWCGTCDKCAFINLILSPFLSAERLGKIFAEEGEPLRKPELFEVFASLIGTATEHKPFECVGEINECRAAVRLAVERSDRSDQAIDAVLYRLAKELPDDPNDLPADRLMKPLGASNVPTVYAPRS